MENEFVAESAAKGTTAPAAAAGAAATGCGVAPRESGKHANIAGKNTALLIPNVSSRSMESGSSCCCCCCCSYACCCLRSSPPSPPPLSHTHPHHTMSSPSATSHHVFLLFLRSLTMPAVSLVNSLANLSYYFLFCPVATSPCLPLSAPTGRLQRMRCVRLLLPEKYLNNSNRKFPRCRLVVYLIKNENNVNFPRSK